MAEAIARSDCSVRPSHDAVLDEQAAGARQFRASPFDVLFGERRAGSDGGDRKGVAGHARRLQNLPILVRCLLETVLDELAHVQGNRVRHRGRIEPRLLGSVLLQRPDQLVHDAGQEERVAPGPTVEHVRELLDIGESATPLTKQGRHVVPGEIVEDEFRRLWLVPKLPEHAAQRRVVEHRFKRAIGPEHEQPGRVTATRHVGQPIERRVVAPLQVLEDEDQGFDGREGLDGFGELAEHAFGTDGCGRIASRRGQRRQMGQPARRAITEHASDRRVRITRQPPEGLENRQVGFTRAELLDALAASNAHGARP